MLRNESRSAGFFLSCRELKEGYWIIRAFLENDKAVRLAREGFVYLIQEDFSEWIGNFALFYAPGRGNVCTVVMDPPVLQEYRA